ncbi:hypothetical protein AAFF_G00025000 [Aldrovandia affinis]|uniref:Tektin n=1 Tax=Aldrovandia affinis TaxID=143900 RepID=A0AAD7T5X0_9TELE|nr:hypothetical protein AAFF_G00025000 [Aldrovandia affinis]
MSEMKMPHTFLPQQQRLRNPLWDYGIPDAELSRSRVIADSQTLMDQSYKAAERMQEDVNKKLEQRIQDIRMWRQELHKKLEEMVQEIEMLVTLRTRIEWAIKNCLEALRITLQCLAEREKNVGIVRDEVERELMKERELIEKVNLRLQCTLKQTNEQIRLSRSSKYYLERDLQDKLQAEQIDGCCWDLTNTAPKQHYAKEPNLTASG